MPVPHATGDGGTRRTTRDATVQGAVRCNAPTEASTPLHQHQRRHHPRYRERTRDCHSLAASRPTVTSIPTRATRSQAASRPSTRPREAPTHAPSARRTTTDASFPGRLYTCHSTTAPPQPRRSGPPRNRHGPATHRSIALANLTTPPQPPFTPSSPPTSSCFRTVIPGTCKTKARRPHGPFDAPQRPAQRHPSTAQRASGRRHAPVPCLP